MLLSPSITQDYVSLSLLLPCRAALRSQLSQEQKHKLLGYILTADLKEPGPVPQRQTGVLPISVISASPVRLATTKQPAGNCLWPLLSPNCPQGLGGQYWCPRPKPCYVSTANLTVPVLKFRGLNLQTWTFRMSLLVWM